jgi:hypothetical protein
VWKLEATKAGRRRLEKFCIPTLHAIFNDKRSALNVKCLKKKKKKKKRANNSGLNPGWLRQLAMEYYTSSRNILHAGVCLLPFI